MVLVLHVHVHYSLASNSSTWCYLVLLHMYVTKEIVEYDKDDITTGDLIHSLQK